MADVRRDGRAGFRVAVQVHVGLRGDPFVELGVQVAELVDDGGDSTASPGPVAEGRARGLSWWSGCCRAVMVLLIPGWE